MLYAKEWLESMELCTEMGNELAETLQVGTEQGGCHHSVCCRVSDEVEKVDGAFPRGLGKPLGHRSWYTQSS